LIVRLVPTAPFALINMAAGATRMSPIAFLAGTGVGVAPKIVVICVGAGAFTRYRAAASEAVWVGAAAVLAWILLGLTARLWARRWDISRQP